MCICTSIDLLANGLSLCMYVLTYTYMYNVHTHIHIQMHVGNKGGSSEERIYSYHKDEVQ